MRTRIDYGQWVNVSGAPSANTMPVPRSGSVSDAPPSELPGHRMPRLIDGGDSGQVVGDFSPGQVRHLAFCRAVDESPPAVQAQLDHVLGTGYGPGR